MKTVLQRHAEAIVAALTGQKRQDPAEIRGDNTPNMKMNEKVSEWMAAHRFPSALVNVRSQRRSVLLDYINQQRELGLFCVTKNPRVERHGNEQLTPSHHHTWSFPIYAAAVYAKRIGDAEVLSATTWWIEANVAVWSKVDRSRCGVVAMAGARAGQDKGDRGKDGVDKDGPRLPTNALRDGEWRLLSGIDGWLKPSKVEKMVDPSFSPRMLSLALSEGLEFKLYAPLPYLAERMVIRYHGDGRTSTSCPDSPPGQGGAQHVVMFPDGSWLTPPEAPLDDVTNEFWTPENPG